MLPKCIDSWSLENHNSTQVEILLPTKLQRHEKVYLGRSLTQSHSRHDLTAVRALAANRSMQVSLRSLTAPTDITSVPQPLPN
ncbi:hypothetical protein E2C01_062387 [Portunus trituberculatus]|uniref:Uncharacterized protein n=1 Tax=Portunus trituberculatus TaxID=210409 RepID=A0A5B7H7Q3_PORTR|nr:hypothetical protein [Portunus trituberculatus]